MNRVDLTLLPLAVILEIFAQHAQTREGQLQVRPPPSHSMPLDVDGIVSCKVELAMLEYRLTRGPRATGGEADSG
jgi:hypothetical protein